MNTVGYTWYQFMPKYKMYASPIEEYPTESVHAVATIHIIENNLDPAVPVEIAQQMQDNITWIKEA